MLSQLRGLVWGIVLTASARSAGAQTTIVDAGQFVISRGGQPAGTENFTIARVITGNATQLRVTATRREGDKQIVDTLVTDTLGSPSYYSYVRSQGTAAIVRVGASRAGNRLTVSSRNPQVGDASTRELLVADGMMLFDQDVYSQFYLLFLPQPSGQPPTLVAPSTGTHTIGAVRGAGPADIQIGGVRVPTTHFIFGDTEIWVGLNRQIIKIEMPGQHVVVTREQPPR